jgi:hypothetical protein
MRTIVDIRPERSTKSWVLPTGFLPFSFLASAGADRAMVDICPFVHRGSPGVGFDGGASRKVADFPQASGS